MSQNGRRRFLAQGAAAAVTAIAGCAPKATEVPVAATCKSRYGADDNLANAIVMAWSNPQYKQQLLTFPADRPRPSWAGVPQADRMSMVKRSMSALQQAKVSQVMDNGQAATLAPYPAGGTGKAPVVLTVAQYNSIPHPDEFSQSPDQLLFVLPDPMGSATMADARTAMCLQVFGM